MNTQQILLFHMNVFRSGQISGALENAGFSCKICTGQDEGKRLMDVFASEVGGSSSGAAEVSYASGGTGLSEEMIVIGTFSGEEIDTILTVLRSCGAGGCLKSVLTGTNGTWPVTKLYTELAREREYYRNRSRS